MYHTILVDFSFSTSCPESHDRKWTEFEPPHEVYIVVATVIPMLYILPRSDKEVVHVSVADLPRHVHRRTNLVNRPICYCASIERCISGPRKIYQPRKHSSGHGWYKLREDESPVHSFVVSIQIALRYRLTSKWTFPSYQYRLFLLP